MLNADNAFWWLKKNAFFIFSFLNTLQPSHTYTFGTIMNYAKYYCIQKTKWVNTQTHLSFSCILWNQFYFFFFYLWILQNSKVLFHSFLFYTIIRGCRMAGWGVISTHRMLQGVLLFYAGHHHLTPFSQYLLQTTMHLKKIWTHEN